MGASQEDHCTLRIAWFPQKFLGELPSKTLPEQNRSVGSVWWYTPLVPVFERQRQTDFCELSQVPGRGIKKQDKLVRHSKFHQDRKTYIVETLSQNKQTNKQTKQQQQNRNKGKRYTKS